MWTSTYIRVLWAYTYAFICNITLLHVNFQLRSCTVGLFVYVHVMLPLLHVNFHIHASLAANSRDQVIVGPCVGRTRDHKRYGGSAGQLSQKGPLVVIPVESILTQAFQCRL